MTLYFRRLLRKWCWDAIRYVSPTYSTDNSLERMLNNAKMLEDYIAEGKILAWSKGA